MLRDKVKHLVGEVSKFDMVTGAVKATIQQKVNLGMHLDRDTEGSNVPRCMAVPAVPKQQMELAILDPRQAAQLEGCFLSFRMNGDPAPANAYVHHSKWVCWFESFDAAWVLCVRVYCQRIRPDPNHDSQSHPSICSPQWTSLWGKHSVPRSCSSGTQSSERRG